MQSTAASILFFAVSALAGVVMIAEGVLLLRAKYHPQANPLPSRVLYGIGALALGPEKSRRLFTGRTTPQSLRAYARWTLTLGALVFASSLVYLLTMVL